MLYNFMRIQSLVTKALLVGAVVVVAAGGGWFARGRAHDVSGVQHADAQAKQYPLLGKRIFADNPNDVIINFVPLRKDLQAKFNALSVQHSFYFEYLPSGTSIREGGDNVLTAASLIKVPLAMNLYRAAELGKVDLDQTVTITPDELDGAYGDLWKKGAGTQLTLRQAAKIMLTQSDNTAKQVIFDHIHGLLTSDQESLNQLDIDQLIESGQAVIDAKSYSSVLKSLYLSSYLGYDDSQEILGYLAHSTATNRLTAQLPKNVTVAHKIGVYNNASWSESDCGVVYLPKRPYVICIMVGLPEDQANTFIAQISKEVYDFVVRQ